MLRVSVASQAAQRLAAAVAGDAQYCVILPTAVDPMQPHSAVGSRAREDRHRAEATERTGGLVWRWLMRRHASSRVLVVGAQGDCSRGAVTLPLSAICCAEFLRAFKGRIPELTRHPAATHVVDELWSVCDGRQRSAMACEFYGREYRVLEGGTLASDASGASPSSLASLLADSDAAKRTRVMQHLAAAVLPIAEKGLVDSAIVHRVLAEFLAAAPASLVADTTASLSGDPLLHMAHTHDGVAAACAVAAYGTPRDRKKALRAVRSHVGALARDEWGHLLLLTLLSVTDDTSLLRKSILVAYQVPCGAPRPGAGGGGRG